MIERLLIALVALVPAGLFQRYCAYRNGHAFSTAVIQTERDFLVDPLTRCTHCGAQMSEAVYVALTNAYAMALSLETDGAWD